MFLLALLPLLPSVQLPLQLSLKVGNSPPEGSEFPIYREVPDQREEVRRGYFI